MILKVQKVLFYLFCTLFISVSVYAENNLQYKDTGNAYQEYDSGNKNQKKYRRVSRRHDRSTFAGAALLWPTGNFRNYTDKLIVDYQYGVSTSYGADRVYENWYGTSLVDLAYSSKSSNGIDSRYYYMNGTYLFGYAKPLDTDKHFSLFLELGPSVGLRAFTASVDSCTGIGVGFTFNGVAYIGLNLYLNPKDRVAAYFRLAGGVLYGTRVRIRTVVNTNINPLMLYGPTLAFGLTW